MGFVTSLNGTVMDKSSTESVAREGHDNPGGTSHACLGLVLMAWILLSTGAAFAAGLA